MKLNKLIPFAVWIYGSIASAVSIDWSGIYRAELVEIDKVTLGGPAGRKSYILNHLSLRPKIVSSDGFNIHSRFDVLNNKEYPDSQLGQRFGGDSRTNTNPNMQDSTSSRRQQQSSSIAANLLYATLEHEYGVITIGRAPLQFGLGMTHNGGFGEFDHWYDSLDMVSYKIYSGNFSIMPAFGKTYTNTYGAGVTASDLIWQFQYESKETKSLLGVFYQNRTASREVNQTPTSIATGGNLVSSFNEASTNIVISRGFETFGIQLEAGFKSGGTGIYDVGGEEVRQNGFGIALELSFPAQADENWDWLIRAGMATGDNPTTKDYEGYAFDRNYDVAYLLFNHGMGQYDLFRSSIYRDTSVTLSDTPDTETISNVLYFAPRATQRVNDRFFIQYTLATGQLTAEPLANSGVSKSVGYEVDIDFVYKINERVKWSNLVGFLMPGDAFVGGTNNYTKAFTYGLSSRLALSF